MEAKGGEAGELTWSRETVPKVLKIVSTRLSQKDLISLLLVSPWLHSTLVSYPPLWLVLPFIFSIKKEKRFDFSSSISRIMVLCDLGFWLLTQVVDFREVNNAGNRLVVALSLVSCLNVGFTKMFFVFHEYFVFGWRQSPEFEISW